MQRQTCPNQTVHSGRLGDIDCNQDQYLLDSLTSTSFFSVALVPHQVSLFVLTGLRWPGLMDTISKHSLLLQMILFCLLYEILAFMHALGRFKAK